VYIIILDFLTDRVDIKRDFVEQLRYPLFLFYFATFNESFEYYLFVWLGFTLCMIQGAVVCMLPVEIHQIGALTFICPLRNLKIASSTELLR